MHRHTHTHTHAYTSPHSRCDDVVCAVEDVNDVDHQFKELYRRSIECHAPYRIHVSKAHNLHKIYLYSFLKKKERMHPNLDCKARNPGEWMGFVRALHCVQCIKKAKATKKSRYTNNNTTHTKDTCDIWFLCCIHSLLTPYRDSIFFREWTRSRADDNVTKRRPHKTAILVKSLNSLVFRWTDKKRLLHLNCLIKKMFFFLFSHA